MHFLSTAALAAAAAVGTEVGPAAVGTEAGSAAGAAVRLAAGQKEEPSAQAEGATLLTARAHV